MASEVFYLGLAESVIKLLILAFEAHKAGDKAKADEIMEEAVRREALVAELRAKSLKKKTK